MEIKTIHVNPIASDGNYTIGFDDDGLPGEWDGNLTETTDYFRARTEGKTFNDGNGEWEVVADWDDTLTWRSPLGAR